MPYIHTEPPVYEGLLRYEAIEDQQDFRITLNLTGNPIPMLGTLVWTFNGQELSLGGGMDGAGISLGLDFIEFETVSRNNAGTYTVFSSNAAGNASFEFELEVFCK